MIERNVKLQEYLQHLYPVLYPHEPEPRNKRERQLREVLLLLHLCFTLIGRSA